MKREIERGIPIPEHTQHHGNTKYPWQEMSVGDAFTFADSITKTAINKARAIVSYHNGKSDKRYLAAAHFPTRTVKIWRTE